MNLNFLLRDTVNSDTAHSREQFFAACYQTLFVKVYAIAKYITPHDAEDVTADIFKKIFELDLPALLKHQDYLEKYLIAIARNYCLTFSKQKLSRGHYRGFEDIDASIFSVDPLGRVDASLDFTEALKRVTPKQRNAIKLMLEGYRYNEIAVTMGITEGAVKNLVYRGKNVIKKFYQEKIPDEQFNPI